MQRTMGFLALWGMMTMVGCALAAKDNSVVGNITQYVSYSAALTNKGTNEIYVLTANLHTYQEPDPNAQMDKVAGTIADLDIDLIAFDECAQNKNLMVVTNVYGIGIRSDNMAKLIVDRLKNDYGLQYYYAWNWTHYGFTQYEEGLAIISKYPITSSASDYISTSTSTSLITTRKVIFGAIYIPLLNENVGFFSTHLNWKTSTSDPEPKNEVLKIQAFVTNYSSSSNLNLVCGDYNSQPTETDFAWSESYRIMTNGYIDTFLADNPHANDMPENSIYDTVKGDYPGRIDYIFMKTNAGYRVRHSEIIFTPDNIGVISDHYGVITVLQKTN